MEAACGLSLFNQSYVMLITELDIDVEVSAKLHYISTWDNLRCPREHNAKIKPVK